MAWVSNTLAPPCAMIGDTPRDCTSSAAMVSVHRMCHLERSFRANIFRSFLYINQQVSVTLPDGLSCSERAAFQHIHHVWPNQLSKRPHTDVIKQHGGIRTQN